jgi:hypothetical protein
MRTVSSLNIFLVVSALFVGGCQVQGASPRPASPSPVPLPVWSGSLAQQFDDSIERETLSIGEPATPEGDLWFGPRAQSADYVARVKVITTTTEGVGPAQGYRLTLRVIGQPFGGPRPPSDTVELVIRPDSPFFPTARQQDVKMTGKVFLGFFKEFEGATPAKMHWYLTGEAPQVLEATHRARVLAEVGYHVTKPRF